MYYDFTNKASSDAFFERKIVNVYVVVKGCSFLQIVCGFLHVFTYNQIFTRVSMPFSAVM